MDKEFKTDRCSGGMSLFKRLLWKIKITNTEYLPWMNDCIEHDKSYWIGGTKNERKYAYCLLMASVARKGYPFMSFFMYICIRIGGIPILPLPWRWGYGYNWPKRILYNKK
jgi:hypothetical protein